MPKTTDGRLAYADLLRVLAAMAVVVLHISAGWLSETTVGSTPWTVLVTYDSLVRWCVPMFVMLSGAFLLDPKKSVKLRDIFLKYILRVLIALLVWGFVYAVLYHLQTGGSLSAQALRACLSKVLWADTHYHLWFLYVIIGLYLITPLLRAFVSGASRGTLHWFFLLVFVFYSLLPTLQAVFPNRMALPMAWSGRLGIHLVLGYTGYYVAGYYLKHYTLGRLAEFALYALGLAGAAGTVWGTLWLSGRVGSTVTVLMEYRSPTVVFFSVAVFVLFRYLLGISDERSRRKRLVGLSSISFGIYLTHEAFIMLLRELGISTLSFNPILSVPVLSAGVFLCACVPSWLLSKLPLLGRYLT